jgi:hypothetical protein
MFFEGAPRLLRSGASILPCHPQDDARLILEAYPALVARRFVGNQGYKNDTKKKQTKEQALARQAILQGLLTKAMTNFGFEVILSEDQVSSLSCDPTGDKLDALLCAVQAAWAYRQKDSNYGIPAHVDPLEGWIIDPQFLMG